MQRCRGELCENDPIYAGPLSSLWMQETLNKTGYSIIGRAFGGEEVATLSQIIVRSGIKQAFGVREFLLRVPELVPVLFNDTVREVLRRLLPDGPRVVRSLYFDKPPNANWIVNWHQDLTVNLVHREDHPGFEKWRSVEDRMVVRPPRRYLDNMVTLRIHLDSCTAENGALRVIPGSHLDGVTEMKNWSPAEECVTICEVPAGEMMVMKPLLLHASRRSDVSTNRRVIHLECCSEPLPGTMQWKEAVQVPF